MKTVQCSVSDYGKLRMRDGKKISRQAITQRITENKEMPGVVSYKKIGPVWILEIDEKFYNENKHNLKG